MINTIINLTLATVVFLVGVAAGVNLEKSTMPPDTLNTTSANEAMIFQRKCTRNNRMSTYTEKGKVFALTCKEMKK